MKCFVTAPRGPLHQPGLIEKKSTPLILFHRRPSVGQHGPSHQALIVYLRRMYRDTVAARDIGVKAAVARLAKLAAVSEMHLEALQLQAEGSRIGQLGVSSGNIMGRPVAQLVASYDEVLQNLH